MNINFGLNWNWDVVYLVILYIFFIRVFDFVIINIKKKFNYGICRERYGLYIEIRGEVNLKLVFIN